MSEMQYPFRETNRSPYYEGDPGRTSPARSRESEYDAEPVFQHRIPPFRSIEGADGAYPQSDEHAAEPVAEHGGDPPQPHPNVGPVRKSNTTVATTNQQRAMIDHLDGAPTSNGEHSSVAAYTASLLQGNTSARQVNPQAALPGYAGSMPETRASRRSKMSRMSRMSKRMISHLRSPCPELHRKRVSSSGDHNQPSSISPPNEVPLPSKPPRTAPRPKSLRQPMDKLPVSRRPVSPFPLDNYRRSEDYERGRQQTHGQPSSPRGDSPIPSAHTRRSTTRGPHPPSASSILAPQPRRPIVANWFRNGGLESDDTRFDSPLDPFGTEPQVAPRSPSLEHLESLLRLPKNASELRPSLRGGADDRSTTYEDRAGEDKSPPDGSTRRLSINAVLNAVSSSLDRVFPPGHPRRTDSPSSLYQPTHQSSNPPLSADPNRYSHLPVYPYSSQAPHMALIPSATQPPRSLPLPYPSSPPSAPHNQPSQLERVNAAQDAFMQQLQHTDPARYDFLRRLQNTDPAQYELLQQIESASRDEQNVQRHLQQRLNHLGPGDQAVLEYHENRRRSLVQQYQHRFPQANVIGNPYQQTSNTYAYADQPPNAPTYTTQVSPHHHMAPQYPSERQPNQVPGSHPQSRPPVLMPVQTLLRPLPEQQPPNNSTIHPHAFTNADSNYAVAQRVAPDPTTGPTLPQPFCFQSLLVTPAVLIL